MPVSYVQLLFALLAGIAFLVLLTTKYHIHPFFALVIACFIVGLGTGFTVPEVLTLVKEGFGNVMKSLGLLIILGTTLGVILEFSGSTVVMANYILKKIPPRFSALSMAIIGFIVGLPIFCDSGYIVLNGLVKPLSRRTSISLTTMAVSLAAGLYSVHCLIPPHPGVSAAAGIIGVDFGKLILIGSLVGIPAMLTGYLWANYAGKKNPVKESSLHYKEEPESFFQPGVLNSFLPVIVPILLISLKSFLLMEQKETLSGWKNIVAVLGEPSIALFIGVLLAFNNKALWKKTTVNTLLHNAVEKAGPILIIIGAGGAFGAVLQATKMGEHLNNAWLLSNLGIFFPFLLAVALKTSLGSSTVAIITAASIIFPLLPVLGLDSNEGRLLCVLAMGAGSMMISHANDAYFWVISKFSDIDMRTMLKVYTTATILMGLISFFFIYLLSLLLF